MAIKLYGKHNASDLWQQIEFTKSCAVYVQPPSITEHRHDPSWRVFFNEREFYDLRLDERLSFREILGNLCNG